MLTIFVRSIIVYLVLLVVMRLMGKRQLSELQPFEFAITLIIAELVSGPMAETSIPLSYGIIPIFTLFIVHLFINKLSAKSQRLRRVINGSPMVIISPEGIDTRKLMQLDMNLDDLMDSLRASGYFNPSEIQYAILETNGKLSILPTPNSKPITAQDLEITVDEQDLPKILISEGKIMDNGLYMSGMSKNKILEILDKYKLKIKQVFLMNINNENKFYIQPFRGKAIQTVIMEKE